ncbi:hypothetical protein SKAU_G00051440 [Synaphobranchus kaupii]|uniref:Uncharacterized protein n=1 Tax=Synaphobranchus kaupii TaxID=118154 RepID=A0A9Q1J7M7_SYNKA|nr:hypothetical protein SKAU_G00051440 [Synaphobranchus kaupii]
MESRRLVEAASVACHSHTEEEKRQRQVGSRPSPLAGLPVTGPKQEEEEHLLPAFPPPQWSGKSAERGLYRWPTGGMSQPAPRTEVTGDSLFPLTLPWAVQSPAPQGQGISPPLLPQSVSVDLGPRAPRSPALSLPALSKHRPGLPEGPRGVHRTGINTLCSGRASSGPANSLRRLTRRHRFALSLSVRGG